MKRIWLAAILLLVPATAHADDRSQENDVRVHLDGPPSASLEQLVGSEWVWKCGAPCDVRVSRTDRYRIAGKGIYESDPFTLTAGPGDDETVHVYPGTTSRATIGTVVFLGGLLATFTGLLIAVAAPSSNCDETSTGYGPPPDCQSHPAVRDTGIGVVVAGLLSVVAGSVIYAANSRSTATQTSSIVEPPRVQFFPMRSVASRVESNASAPVPLPNASVSPVFSFSF